jgi:DNA-binding GntR family transcriptional regulator
VTATNLDNRLRRLVYDTVRERGAPPSVAELSTRTAESQSAVRAALVRLAAARMFVLQPTSGEVLMAPPFSAVPTPFLVRTSLHESYANCAWDALGVPVTLAEPAQIVSACGCCGDAMTLQTDGTTTPRENGVIHFAVPARRWWEDLVFT